MVFLNGSGAGCGLDCGTVNLLCACPVLLTVKYCMKFFEIVLLRFSAEHGRCKEHFSVAQGTWGHTLGQ